MSKAELIALLYRISERLDEIDKLRLILWICEEKLDHQALQGINDTASLLKKLEEWSFLGADDMQVVKDILKAVDQWDLYDEVVMFEGTRKEYKKLLERLIDALEGLNDLERLKSTVCIVRRIPEERKNDIRDVKSLFQVLEDMNCLRIDCLDILTEIFTEIEKGELVKELEDFQNRRIEDEGRKRRKAREAAVWSSARAAYQRIIGEVRVHCTFRKLSGVVLVVGTGLILRRCSTLGDFVEAFRVATLPAANALRAISEGSACFTVQAETSFALEELHERYSTGRLQRDLQEFLVTDDIRQLAEGEEVVVSVYINEKEFRKVLDDLTNVDPEDSLQAQSKLRDKFPQFVNRKTDELLQIVECLDPKNRQCQGVFIDGAPGIGKTTLATEAANKLRRDNGHVLVAYIDCKDMKSFESFAGTIIEQICLSPFVDDPAAEIKKRLIASKDYFYILFLDNFECFLEESNNQQENQPSTAAALRLGCGERVISFIGEIAKCATNIKFLVTSSEKVPFLPMLAIKAIHLNPFDKDESSKLLEKVRCGEKISDEQSEELCKICSGIPLVLHTLMSQEDLIGLVDIYGKSPPEGRAIFLQNMKTAPKDKKIEFCLEYCFQRLRRQVQLTILRLCLYRGLFTPAKAARIFCSSKSSEHHFSVNVLELGRCNLLHQQKPQDTSKYTLLTVIREYFKHKATEESYREEIRHSRSLLIDYLISFLKETFKVFLGKNSVKSAIEEFSAEKGNVMQLVEWIANGEMDEERVKKSIDVFNVAGEMLAKLMAKLNYRNVYKSLSKKCEEMGDQRRVAECLTSLGIKEIFNCICATGLCKKAIERARPHLEKARKIQSRLRVRKGNSRAQCLAKLGRCLVKSGDKERGKAMIEDAIRIREIAVKTPDDHEEEGGANVCYVMLGATYNDKAVALSFENDHRETVKIRENQVMPIYRERLGDHPFTANILNNLSNNHRHLKEFVAAEQYAREALRIRRELLADHRDTTKSLFDLGMALKANKKFREAKDLLEQCETMLEKVVNDDAFEKKANEELRDVNRLLETKQLEGQDQGTIVFAGKDFQYCHKTRSMKDSQQKPATVVYRAGTKGGPSFDSDKTINEAWLVTNPKLYFPLGQDLPEPCKKCLEGISLWKADVSTLRNLGFTYDWKYDGVIKVELNDSRNSKCASKEIKELLKSLEWQETTVPQCSGGLSLMDLSPLVQAVIVYMKDHYPTTPRELNFHAELKAASQWYWLEEKDDSSALKEVPAYDCRLKIAVRETLKTWEEEEKGLQAKLQSPDYNDSSDGSVDEELSDVREAIEVLKNYLSEDKKVEGDDLSLEAIPHCKSKRSVLGPKMGPFRTEKELRDVNRLLEMEQLQGQDQ